MGMSEKESERENITDPITSSLVDAPLDYPPSTTHFLLKKGAHGAPVQWLDEHGTLVQKIPIAEFDRTKIRKLWGARSDYYVQFFTKDSDNRMNVRGNPKMFGLPPLPSDGTVSVAGGASAPGTPLAETFALISALRGLSREDTEHQLALARESHTLQMTMVSAMFQTMNQPRAPAPEITQLATIVQSLAQQVADLREEDDGPEDAPSLAGTVATAAQHGWVTAAIEAVAKVAVQPGVPEMIASFLKRLTPNPAVSPLQTAMDQQASAAVQTHVVDMPSESVASPPWVRRTA